MNYVMLKDVCAIHMGQSPDSNSYNGNGDGIPFFQGNADFGERYPITKKWCSAPTKMASPEDILISVRAPIGAINYAKENCCIGRGLAAITPDKTKVSSEFIFWLLKGKNAELNRKGTGSTFKAIGRKILEEILVPDISLEKQLQYATVLEKVYGIIQARKLELQKLDVLIKARFIEMFGDPVDNPYGWPTKGLMELGSCKNGMNFGARDQGTTIQSVGVGDIKDYDYIEDIDALTTLSLNETPTEEYLLRDGDLVFVRSNGNKNLVGRCTAIYPHGIPVTFSGFCIRFRKESDAVLLDYLLRYLKMPEVRLKMSGRGANIQNLNQKILAALQVPVPPLDKQSEYVALVKQSDKSKVMH